MGRDIAENVRHGRRDAAARRLGDPSRFRRKEFWAIVNYQRIMFDFGGE
jgi:hypothetical protein